MMGYDVSWASFAIVETMSQARFAHKRIGYLAACQCFSETTDVVLLATNLLKKEFQSTSQYEVGLAVNCLANIVTRDLARDLLQDSVMLMSHSKPHGASERQSMPMSCERTTQSDGNLQDGPLAEARSRP